MENVTSEECLNILMNSNLDKKELAEKLGVSYRSILNYLGGRKIPPYIRKLIQYEFVQQNDELKEPASNYSLPKDLQKRINDLKEMLKEKQNTIDLQQKVISLLESKLNDKNEKNSNSA